MQDKKVGIVSQDKKPSFAEMVRISQARLADFEKETGEQKDQKEKTWVVKEAERKKVGVKRHRGE